MGVINFLNEGPEFFNDFLALLLDFEKYLEVLLHFDDSIGLFERRIVTDNIMAVVLIIILRLGNKVGGSARATPLASASASVI